jgi:hypothetical protein
MATQQVLYRFSRRPDEEVIISVNEYKSKRYLDLRIFFQPKDREEMLPTKKGISLDLAHFDALKKGILACEKRVNQLQTMEVEAV